MEPGGHQKPRPYYYRRKPRPTKSDTEPKGPVAESPLNDATLNHGPHDQHISEPNRPASTPSSVHASMPIEKTKTPRKRGYISSKKQPSENRAPMARPQPRPALSTSTSIPALPHVKLLNKIETTSSLNPIPTPTPTPTPTPEQVLDEAKRKEDQMQRNFSLQQSELVMMKIRYPSIQVVHSREEKEDFEEIKFELDLPITDPDFPFELESIHLLILWPILYPLASYPKVTLKDSNIPHTIGKKIQGFLDKGLPRWQGESCMRSLLHSIEQNLEKWAVAPDPLDETSSGSGSHSCGIKFVPAPPKSANSEGPRIVRLAPPPSSQHSTTENGAIESKIEGLHISQPPSASLNLSTLAASTVKPLSSGISICLVQPLLTQVALLKVVILSLRLVCSRCSRSFTAVPSLRPLPLRQKLSCPFCRVVSEAALQPASFFPGCADGLLARVQVSNASVVDLLPSDYILTCATCLPSEESDVSNETLVKAVGRGQTQYLACRSCHTSLAFCINDVHFTPFPSAAQMAAMEAKKGSSIKKKNAKGGFVPTPGKQLPDYGTCKHYKKSFRWLRFPCCGGAYPCDLCHELDNKDHEIQWANKMICGYCSKEQPFSQKPCVCGKSLSTASQRKSTHWEGGKGARDPTTMSKKDSRKYKLMGAASSTAATAASKKK